MKLDRFLARRRAVVAAYDSMLSSYAPLVKPARPHADLPCPPGTSMSHGSISPPPAIGRAPLMRALAQDGIGTQVHYFPVHRQPYYAARYGATLPGADRYYAQALSLPLSAAMGEGDAERVIDALARHLKL